MKEERDNGFTRHINFEPGYNRRAEGNGVHGMSIRFVLVGTAGAVQFLVGCGWVPGEKMHASVASYYPMGSDVGYHSPTPRYEDHWPMGDGCPWLDGGTCYYDGSGLRADDWLPRFIAEGEDAVWELLAEEYEAVFLGSGTSEGSERA